MKTRLMTALLAIAIANTVPCRRRRHCRLTWPPYPPTHSALFTFPSPISGRAMP